MKGARIENARKTALALYWFCGALSIPVLVYGHSVHNTCSSEVVDICSYAEFDAIDGNDAVRIAGMETIDCNRDGAALIYQNGFLNISDLKTMPVKLTKLLMAYLR